MRNLAALLFVILMGDSGVGQSGTWEAIDSAHFSDDDLGRHFSDPQYAEGLTVEERKFSEAGFNWHLIRFENSAKPNGPLWVVPHDDENAAFEAMVAALKKYGGVGVAVNSGAGSARMQVGKGTCGGRAGQLSACDPNRNFSEATPVYTGAFLDQLKAGQPVIALHTNAPGHGASPDSVTILDVKAHAAGKIRPRVDGFFGNGSVAALNNYDTFVYVPYLRSSGISAVDSSCRVSLNTNGVHVFHESVEPTAKRPNGDGSMSNYMAIFRRDTRYINAESRRESNLKIAADRHLLMIDTWLTNCL